MGEYRSREKGSKMLNRLQRLFPSLITDKDVDSTYYNNYQWYILEQNTIIGIAKDEMSSKDTVLFSTFLTPYNMQLPRPSNQEKAWLDLIQTNDVLLPKQHGLAYRFVYFSIQKNQIDPSSFKEAIETIFQQQVPILWSNEYQGVIVEEMSSTNAETLSYEQIIDTLMSDLYVKITFFVGAVLTTYEDIKNHYNSLLKGAKIASVYSQKAVITYIDIIPYLFIEKMDLSERKQISQIILKETSDDPELLKTMETFMSCNLNISETAKELYMHRNSLQYRLDKFYEKTGIDVRQFHHATTLYLVLKANT